MKKALLIISCIFSFTFSSCKGQSTIDISEVSPWCIVTFDKLKRTPEQRIDMLNNLGIKKYGYNWRENNLIDTKKEFRLAKENDIEITSTLIWLNAKRDSIGNLSARNQKMLQILKETDTKPIVWVSFSNNFFKKLNQEASVNLAIDFIKYVKTKTDEAGCQLALYNHKGWFGNPYNQIEILERLQKENINLKIVFNFHHAHDFVDDFSEIFKKIKPYTYHINLNGMVNSDQKIFTLGKGKHEQRMIKTLIKNDYQGSWGVLGHINEEDVEEVLKRNIKGYISLMSNVKN